MCLNRDKSATFIATISCCNGSEETWASQVASEPFQQDIVAKKVALYHDLDTNLTSADLSQVKPDGRPDNRPDDGPTFTTNQRIDLFHQ